MKINLESFINEAKKEELHTIILLKHGKEIIKEAIEPYSLERPTHVYSLSKSFTSTAIGIACDEGLIDLENYLYPYFLEECPDKMNEHLEQLKIKHLLMMATGHDKDISGIVFESDNWEKTFFEQKITHEPGTKFVYNTAATYILSSLLQRITGLTLVEYLTPRLFEPLGMIDIMWEESPSGVNKGGMGLYIKPIDIARFGQLYLQNGMWEGKQILSQEYIRRATSFQINNGNPKIKSDWTQGYGYQFWMCQHGIYRGDGAFGQYCIIFPKQDAVCVMTSATDDMQKMLNLVWQDLLPILDMDLEPIKLKNESYEPLPFHSSSLMTQFNYSYYLNTSQTMNIFFQEEYATIDELYENIEIKVGYGKWMITDNIAACGTWTDEYTFKVICLLLDTPHTRTITYQFTECDVTITGFWNVSFEPKELPMLHGFKIEK